MTDQLRALIEQWGERADQLERLARANAVDHQSLAAALLAEAMHLRTCADELLAAAAPAP